MAGKAAAASQEAFRSQASSLEDINETQQDDVELLPAELIEADDENDRIVVDSNTVNTGFRFGSRTSRWALALDRGLNRLLTRIVWVETTRGFVGGRC